MTVGAKDDWNVWYGFERLWADLASEERDAFWKNAGKYAYDMNHRSALYQPLCLALHEIESGKSVKRVSGSIPIRVKPRSADELKRAVVRHKAQLLLAGSAQEFLINAACSWIQCSFTAALNDMLDAVGCGRDEAGTRKGPIPVFSPDDASREALRLAAIHGTRRMTLVCAGLMLSDAGWSRLHHACESLNRATAVEPLVSPPLTAAMVSAPAGAVVRAAEPNPASQPDSAERPFSPIDEASLHALGSDLESLANLLATATAAASSGEVPDLSLVIEFWEPLHVRHAAVAAQLNVGTLRLADLAEALKARSRYANDLAQLARCHAIRHVSEPDFAPIRDKCDELEEAFRHGRHSSAADLAVRSLLRLVDEGDHLDDDLAADLQFEVDAVFGRTVAAAAVRGKLVAGPSDSELVVSGESSMLLTAALAEASLEARAPASDPMPPGEPVAGDPVVHESVSPDDSPVPDATVQPRSASPVVEATTVAASLEIAVPTTDANPRRASR